MNQPAAIALQIVVLPARLSGGTSGTTCAPGRQVREDLVVLDDLVVPQADDTLRVDLGKCGADLTGRLAVAGGRWDDFSGNGAGHAVILGGRSARVKARIEPNVTALKVP